MFSLPKSWGSFERIGYGSAFLAYLLFFLALFSPYLIEGKLIIPFRPSIELGDTTSPAEGIENLKFGDYMTVFIPEVNHHLIAPRSGWLATWNDQNELGRPSFASGFSPAYFPTWILQKFITDPFRFITVFSLGLIFLTGVFCLLLMKEMGFAPVAGFVAAWSLATAPIMIYWLSFPMFTATLCWVTGILYSVLRLGRGWDLGTWGLLSFCTYSALITAYPMSLLLNAYIIMGFFSYVIYAIWRKNGISPALSFSARCGSAVVFGLACSLPVYIDLLNAARESARLDADTAFFTAHLPALDSVGAVIHFLSLSVFPEVFGNPIIPAYPFRFDGLSLTPVLLFLILIAFPGKGCRSHGWWIVAAIFFCVAVIKPLYIFGIRHLGFNLSAINPLGVLPIPLAMISAYGAEAVIRRLDPARLRSRAVVAASVSFVLLLAAQGYAFSQGISPSWLSFGLIFVVLVSLATWSFAGKTGFVIVSLVLSMLCCSRPLLLMRGAGEIKLSSPLVDSIRANLPEGSCFAVVDVLPVMHPNFNSMLGLPSIHSYNGISARRYHEFIISLGGSANDYGRYNDRISPDFTRPAFWMSNIGLVLAAGPLESEELIPLGQTGSVWLHRVKSTMGSYLRISVPYDFSPGGLMLEDPRKLQWLEARKTIDQGDFLEFETPVEGASTLVLSRKYHKDWRGSALVGENWIEVPAFSVNGFFQAVSVPDGAGKVRLSFEPMIRYAWVGHVFFGIFSILFLISTLRKKIQKHQNT